MSQANMLKKKNKGADGQINSKGTPYQKDPYGGELGEVDMLKYGQTPDALIAKGGSSAAVMDYDQEMGGKPRKPFTRDDFMMLITDTYNEYYGKFKDQFNPDEYL